MSLFTVKWTEFKMTISPTYTRDLGGSVVKVLDLDHKRNITYESSRPNITSLIPDTLSKDFQAYLPQ